MKVVTLHHIIESLHEKYVLKNHIFARHQTSLQILNDIIGNGDIESLNQFRIDSTFDLLCELSCEEQLCMFSHVPSHHAKSRTINNRFKHSKGAVSRFFNFDLKAVFQL